MLNNFDACAIRTGDGIMVRMSGMLPTPSHYIDITGYYPGTIFFVVDPGHAIVNLVTRVRPGPALQVLVPWKQSLSLQSSHHSVHITLDNVLIATVQVEEAYVVAVLTGGINPSNDYHILPADQPILGIYSVVFGPASRSWCEAYVRAQSGGRGSNVVWDGNLPWRGTLAASGGEIPVSYRIAGGEGSERPWPLKVRDNHGSVSELNGIECELAAADWIAASQIGDALTIIGRVWVPSTAWHPQLSRSMLAVEPPSFILSRCRVGPEKPMKMTLVELRQSFNIGATRASIKVATSDGVQEIKVHASGEAGGEARLAVASILSPKSKTAIGYSKAFKFDEAHAEALKELDKVCPPSPTFTTTKVEAIGTESGGFTGINALYVVVSRVI
jgi:hypothetical protein